MIELRWGVYYYKNFGDTVKTGRKLQYRQYEDSDTGKIIIHDWKDVEEEEI